MFFLKYPWILLIVKSSLVLKLICVDSHQLYLCQNPVLLLTSYWERSLKRCECRLTTELFPGDQRSHLLPCPWNGGFTRLSHSRRLLQGHNLEIVIWCWKHLHSICDWIQLRSLYKLKRFVGWQKATNQPGVACPFLRPLPAFWVQELVSHYTWEAPETVVNQY